MLKRVNVPNLFMLVGQPNNGKTTLSNWMERQLGCEVIHTDQVYQGWMKLNHPSQHKGAMRNIRAHYPTLEKDVQRAWHEYVTDHILAAVRRARLDVVAEGWLLLYLPDDLRHRLGRRATLMTVTMRRYVAHALDKSIKADGKDYTNTIKGLCKLMAYGKGINFMRNLVKYQSFEDVRDFQGVSDSCGKWLALNMPTDLAGKTVIDVGCGTGYFAIRCAQRGAKSVGIDKRKRHVVTASRLANAIYRRPDIRFYHADMVKWATEKAWKFDYLLAVNLLPEVDAQQFFSFAKQALKPGGTLVLETSVCAVKPTHPMFGKVHVETAARDDGRTFEYLSEPALYSYAKLNDFVKVFRGRSVRMRGARRRRVYHFQNGVYVPRNMESEVIVGEA